MRTRPLLVVVLACALAACGSPATSPAPVASTPTTTRTCRRRVSDRRLLRALLVMGRARGLWAASLVAVRTDGLRERR